MPEYRKKLIEVALPLEAVNKESAREKSIRHGHPSTLHPWWARRPLVACRAVLFASLVDDPASCLEEFPSEEAQDAERQRLFRIIEDLVKWENSNNEAVLHRVRTEIARSVARTHGVSLPHRMTPTEVAEILKKYAPPVLDPFAGSGSIPLEAQRLGLEAHASDLNPVAVLINKALIEIPPKFANRPPIHPEENKTLLQREWRGVQGLTEDVRYYGNWMIEEAWKRIGHLYPKVTLPKEQGGGEATVIAWLWARNVKCPNPACGTRMPLVRSFALSAKKGRETYAQPIFDQATKTIYFEVQHGKNFPEGTVNRSGAKCLGCGGPVPFDYIRAEGQGGRISQQLMAIAAEGQGRRIYLAPNAEHQSIAVHAEPQDVPETNLPEKALGFRVQQYGMTKHRDLFTPRQLVALTTLSNLVGEVRILVLNHSDSDIEYADMLATYLALIVDKLADLANSLCPWEPVAECPRNLFARQAISMQWNFAEGNPVGQSSGSWTVALDNFVRNLNATFSREIKYQLAFTKIEDATNLNSNQRLISTDPPYYDNISYADLSDFFYVWLRRSLSKIYPDLFSTLLVPKDQELISDPFRHGSREKARIYFEEGLGRVFANMREAQDPIYPLTIYYAFKQAEATEEDSINHFDNLGVRASTGWETMLEGLLKAGFVINGTWPVRTELEGGIRVVGRNSLASSIVLVCRPLPVDAPLTTRRDFLNALKRELPHALRNLQHGNIAPVDLAQAAIGPGMAVFSRYKKVLESDGTAMRVRTALQLINQTLDEVMTEQEGEYDADTRWAVAWFEHYGMEEGPYGVAETLSKAKNTAVGTLVEAGILRAQGGKVRLLCRNELSSDWNPAAVKRLTIWEVTQRLIRALQEQGDQGAAAILDHVGEHGEVARDLAYRLYTTCERKKWAEEAMAYNSLVVEWPDISGELERMEKKTTEQAPLF